MYMSLGWWLSSQPALAIRDVIMVQDLEGGQMGPGLAFGLDDVDGKRRFRDSRSTRMLPD
jgi:hypothetical protein